METQAPVRDYPLQQLESGRLNLDLDLDNGLRFGSVVIVPVGRGALKSPWVDVAGTGLITDKNDIVNVQETTEDEAA